MIKICREEPCIIKIGIVQIFFGNCEIKGACTFPGCLDYGKEFEQFLWEPIENIFKRSVIVLRVVKRVNKYAIDSFAY